MSLLVTRLLRRHGSKMLWGRSSNILKMSSGCSDECPPPPPCVEPPPAVPEGPEPPPCPKLPPPCPPPFCAQIPDPANPCNYCPPVCIDPDYSDLRRLKKYQCKFQEDNGLPIFLKGGSMDTILYQATMIIVILEVIYLTYVLLKNG